VLFIRSGFRADSDLHPAFFYLNADPDLDPGSQSNANPDPGHTFKSQNVAFLHEYMLEVTGTGTRGRYHDTVGQKTMLQKPFLNAGNQVIC
jgi:hypothetical protein